jgi:uncharacterized protein (DUF924 family)
MKWYKKDESFDRDIAARFSQAHADAAAGNLDAWQRDATGSLALLLLLDQFSRNLFRGSPQAFAQDAMARRIAQSALDRGFDQKIAPPLRQFFYLPFMHSETSAIRNAALRSVTVSRASLTSPMRASMR